MKTVPVEYAIDRIAEISVVWIGPHCPRQLLNM
jgi:hypothetical protein